MKSQTITHSRKNSRFPKPEIYVIYTGEKKIEKVTLSLSKDFFNGEKVANEVTAKVIYDNEKDIEKGQVSAIQNLVKSLGMTCKEAMDAIGIPEEKQAALAAMI